MNITLHPINWNETWYATLLLLLLSGMSLGTAAMLAPSDHTIATGLLYVGLSLIIFALIYTWKSHPR